MRKTSIAGTDHMPIPMRPQTWPMATRAIEVRTSPPASGSVEEEDPGGVVNKHLG